MKKANRSREEVRVVSRSLGNGGVAATPKRKPRRYAAEARMAVPLEAHRRPVSLPHLQLDAIPWRTVAWLLVALAAALLFALPVFHVQQVSVQGAQLIPAADLQATLADLSGDVIWLVRPQALASRLMDAFPQIASVQVTRQFYPAAIQVRVTERQPLLVLQQAGRLYLVDREGMVFAARATVTDLPVLESAVPLFSEETGQIDPVLVQAATQLVAHMPAGSMLFFQPQLGLGWQQPDGVRVVYGFHPENVTMQMRLWQAISTELAQRGISPALIDVSSLRAPYFKTGY